MTGERAVSVKNDIPEEMNENLLLVFKSELFYWGSRALYQQTSSQMLHHGNWDVISIPLNREWSEYAEQPCREELNSDRISLSLNWLGNMLALPVALGPPQWSSQQP